MTTPFEFVIPAGESPKVRALALALLAVGSDPETPPEAASTLLEVYDNVRNRAVARADA